jgi:hypothetical protein
MFIDHLMELGKKPHAQAQTSTCALRTAQDVQQPTDFPIRSVP